jgi:non-heme Fe2+,alpha-ketoglutarate-dependent halogenase
MGKVLDESAIAGYRERGIHFPLRALETQEVAQARQRLASTREKFGGRLAGRMNQKPHLLFPWLADMVRHPRVLDAVEDVLGTPDILCWASAFFAKDAGDGSFVSWHQDATYWGLSSPDVVTAWVAFTPSTVASGCMRVVPGTHLRQLEHKDSFHERNLLTRGQEIAAEVDEADAVDVLLEPGEFSLHHVLIVHGSAANRADHPRIGFAMRYIPTSLRQLSGIRDSATLVRGTDRHGNFDHEEAPRADLDADAVAHHASVVDAKMKILYRGAEARKPGAKAS